MSVSEFRRWSLADLRNAEEHVRRGSQVIADQKRRIDQLEEEGQDTFYARSTLGLMEQMQLQLVEDFERVTMALHERQNA